MKSTTLFAALAGIECFVLSVTHAAELLVVCWRFRAVALAHKLNDAFTLIEPSEMLLRTGRLSCFLK
jgi:hypothetical protein